MYSEQDKSILASYSVVRVRNYEPKELRKTLQLILSLFPQVSYRIGEKGSVKILYSENESAFGSSPGISPGLHTSSSTSSGASDDLNAEIAAYLPPPPPQQQQPPQQPPQQVRIIQNC